MRQVVGTAVVVPAMLILVSGCATRGWVREELGKRDTEIGQRIVKVNERVGEETQRVSARVEKVEGRVGEDGQRLGTLETSVTSVSEAVRDARESARAAMAKAEGVDSRLTRLWANRYSPKVVDTIQVQFGFDRAELDDGAQTALLDVAKELQANPSLVVELTGYTDMRGPREYNYALSQRRVESVRRFLVEKGVQLGRIQAVGLGALPDRSTPDIQKRRVTAKLMLDQD
jgi:outer membrane protein OmpA-like peptidoglycan-associated protein